LGVLANLLVEGQYIGRLGQTMGAGRNEGQERMLMVEKMNKEGNSQEGKLEIWMEAGGLGVG